MIVVQYASSGDQCCFKKWYWFSHFQDSSAISQSLVFPKYSPKKLAKIFNLLTSSIWVFTNKIENVVCCATFLSKQLCPLLLLKLGMVLWENCNRNTELHINTKDEIKDESLNNNAKNFLSMRKICYIWWRWTPASVNKLLQKWTDYFLSYN